MISRKCLACNGFQTGCIGSQVSCGKWMQLSFDCEDAVNSRLPIKETRTQKFLRIGKKRQQQALEAIRKLEHLTSRYHRKREGVTAYTYEWTAKQAAELIVPIEEALEKLKRDLLRPDMPREHGLLD